MGIYIYTCIPRSTRPAFTMHGEIDGQFYIFEVDILSIFLHIIIVTHAWSDGAKETFLTLLVSLEWVSAEHPYALCLNIDAL